MGLCPQPIVYLYVCAKMSSLDERERERDRESSKCNRLVDLAHSLGDSVDLSGWKSLGVVDPAAAQIDDVSSNSGGWDISPSFRSSISVITSEIGLRGVVVSPNPDT